MFKPDLWSNPDIVQGHKPSADAITQCLKTKDNELSAWLVGEDGDAEKAIIAVSSKFKNADTIYAVLIDVELIKRYNLEFIVKPADTLFEDHNDKHVEIQVNNGVGLCKICAIYVKTFRSIGRSFEDVYETCAYRREVILGMLSRALEEGLIRRKGMCKHLKAEIDEYNEKQRRFMED
jgi:hypothetical protein